MKPRCGQGQLLLGPGYPCARLGLWGAVSPSLCLHVATSGCDLFTIRTGFIQLQDVWCSSVSVRLFVAIRTMASPWAPSIIFSEQNTGVGSGRPPPGAFPTQDRTQSPVAPVFWQILYRWYLPNVISY